MISDLKTLPWKIGLEEFTTTNHRTTIERSLSSINKDRHFITIVSGMYRSDETVLTGLDARNLLINKPLDWQDKIASAKIFFRDSFSVWNFFRTKIVCATHNTVYTTIPERVHRLQRRRNFRVAPPFGSKTSFQQSSSHCFSAIVNDISAGGMLISTDAKGPSLDDQSELNKIEIKIPTQEKGSDSHMLLPLIKQGKIVRTFSDNFTGRTFFGIAFASNHEVKDEISKYVIHREQEILRQSLKKSRNFSKHT